jgi:hypothetical protein
MENAFHFDQMIPQLLFITGGGDSQAILNWLLQSSHGTNFMEIFLSGIHVDQPIVDVVVEIFLKTKDWEGIHMGQCTGMVQGLIEHACLHVQKVSVLCDSHGI